MSGAHNFGGYVNEFEEGLTHRRGPTVSWTSTSFSGRPPFLTLLRGVIRGIHSISNWEQPACGGAIARARSSRVDGQSGANAIHSQRLFSSALGFRVPLITRSMRESLSSLIIGMLYLCARGSTKPRRLCECFSWLGSARSSHSCMLSDASAIASICPLSLSVRSHCIVGVRSRTQTWPFGSSRKQRS